MNDFIFFFRKVTEELHAEGHFGTAHVYRSALNAVVSFHGGGRIPFSQLTPGWLKRFETHLRSKGCSWNTVSTYLRMVRAVYNRAVDRGRATHVPRLFRSVYTGTRAERKRALSDEEMRLVLGPPATTSSSLRQEGARELFALMFLMRGLPFVDLAYLRKSDLRGDMITYRRRKTGKTLSVTLTPDALGLLRRRASTNEASPYLFPILTGDEGTEEAYREYRLALRTFNRRLESFGRTLGLEGRLSSYTARHTWATLAYHCEIHPGIISEAMGHSSITVTETYLKPFRNRRIDEANKKVIEYVKRETIRRTP